LVFLFSSSLFIYLP